MEDYKLGRLCILLWFDAGGERPHHRPVVRTLGKPGATWTGETVRLAVTVPGLARRRDIYRATVGKSLKPATSRRT